MTILLIIFLIATINSQSYTLQTCSTEFGVNTPNFYKKYFHCVSAYMSDSGNYINLYFNGTPPYQSWYWSPGHPNYIPFESQGIGYYQNPGNVGEFDLVISIPIDPQQRTELLNEDIDQNLIDGEVNSSPLEYAMGSVGVALNGVNMFNPLASPGDIIENEIYSFDFYNGHPAGQNGFYHYHTKTKGPLEVINYKIPDIVTETEPGEAEIEIYGIMCDGTVVMGCKEADGSSVNEYELDAQHGHIHDIVDETGEILLQNRYHTHICYNDITVLDLNENGYPQHEFTPEIQYYDVPDSEITFNGTCGAMFEILEPNLLDINDKHNIQSVISILQIYPNPFNPITSISYIVNNSGIVKLNIYDLNGKKVYTLFEKFHDIGHKTYKWNAGMLTAGIYYVHLEIDHQKSVQKVILLK